MEVIRSLARGDIDDRSGYPAEFGAVDLDLRHNLVLEVEIFADFFVPGLCGDHRATGSIRPDNCASTPARSLRSQL